MTPIYGTQPITCTCCHRTASLDDCDCGLLPDAMVFCPECLAIIEVPGGGVVEDDDLEVVSGEF